jgi:hypothetical protein
MTALTNGINNLTERMVEGHIDMNANLEHISTRFGHLADQLAVIARENYNTNCRVFNAGAATETMSSTRCCSLREWFLRMGPSNGSFEWNRAGKPSSPSSKLSHELSSVLALTDDECGALLTLYLLPVDPMPTRGNRLRIFFGMPSW